MLKLRTIYIVGNNKCDLDWWWKYLALARDESNQIMVFSFNRKLRLNIFEVF